MRFDDNSGRASRYSVDVHPDAAFTIIYKDDIGSLLFVIEIGEDPKLIFLNAKPSGGERMADTRPEAAAARVGLAVERVVAYFNAKGLRVAVENADNPALEQP